MESFLSSSDTIISSPGFDLSSAELEPPIDIELQAGLAIYPGQFYNGQANFISLRGSFSNQTIPFTPDFGSIAISENVWLAITLDSGNLIILYDTAPLITLPSKNQPITIIDYQSSTCQPPCSGSGVCTASATCACAEGFAGSSCESCASGFVGPACQPCPSPCKSCNQTTGLCSTSEAFKLKVKRAQKTCNCQNGICSSDGSCSCLPGWTNATDLNGVTCAQCAPGFFLASTGDCQGKILYISFFFPPSNNSQYANVDALNAKMARETAILARRVSTRIKLTARSAMHCQL
jgi:hypothetical protein